MDPLVVLAVTVGILCMIGSIVYLAVWRFNYMSNGVIAGWIAVQVVGVAACCLILASVFRTDDGLLFTFGALAVVGPAFLIASGLFWTYVIRRGLRTRAQRGLPLPAGVDREQALNWRSRHQC